MTYQPIKIPQPDTPTIGLKDIFVKLMSEAIETDDEETRLILKIHEHSN